jgi:hypothetical protein
VIALNSHLTALQLITSLPMRQQKLRRLLWTCGCCASALVLVRPAIGATVPFQPLVGAPNSYVPGESVMFDLRLPVMSALAAYDIDLVLEGTTGTAGVDFFFDVEATAPSSVNYVFSSAANYFDAAIVDGAARHVLTLTDFDFVGVNVSTGVNDRVATVVLRTLTTYRGVLNVWVNSPTLILDAPAIVPTPVAEFAGIQAAIAAAGPIVLTPVPEPFGLSLVASGFGMSWTRRRRWAHAHGIA